LAKKEGVRRMIGEENSIERMGEVNEGRWERRMVERGWEGGVLRKGIIKAIGNSFPCLKVHKNENFFGFDFEFCTISLLVMSKY
jgi:hypothetical protein